MLTLQETLPYRNVSQIGFDQIMIIDDTEVKKRLAIQD